MGFKMKEPSEGGTVLGAALRAGGVMALGATIRADARVSFWIAQLISSATSVTTFIIE